MTESTPYILPKVPSQLIEIALEDLEKCERSPDYEIDMGHWFYMSASRCCYVCLAGAVMATRLGALESAVTCLISEDFPANTAQLTAINSLRVGSVRFTCSYLEIEMPESLAETYPITTYEKDSTAFKRDMRELAETLKAAGI